MPRVFFEDPKPSLRWSYPTRVETQVFLQEDFGEAKLLTTPKQLSGRPQAGILQGGSSLLNAAILQGGIIDTSGRALPSLGCTGSTPIRPSLSRRAAGLARSPGRGSVGASGVGSAAESAGPDDPPASPSRTLAWSRRRPSRPPTRPSSAPDSTLALERTRHR